MDVFTRDKVNTGSETSLTGSQFARSKRTFFLAVISPENDNGPVIFYTSGNTVN